MKNRYFKIFMCFIVISMFILLGFNIVNRTQDHHLLKIEEKSEKQEYSYFADSVHYLYFVLECTPNKADILGYYELNNRFHISDIGHFLIGKKVDQGSIEVSVDEQENCVYISCVSDRHLSEPAVISKVGLYQDTIQFKDYDFTFHLEQSNRKDGQYVLMKGKSRKDRSEMTLYCMSINE